MSSSPSAVTEADLDKYATLFSPATPRASPSHAPVSLPPDESDLKPTSHSRHSTDDFGAFVSVSASEDPLAAFESLDDATTASTTASKRVSASLHFFDKFGQDAKVAAERNKRDLLDELLLHDEDPLYWLKDPGPSTQTASTQVTEVEAEELAQATEASLIDLSSESEHESLPPKPRSQSTSPSSSPTRHPSRWANASYPQLARKRSSSLAPPVASTSTVTSVSTSSDSDISRPSSPEDAMPFPPRSTSYQTLSNLSSKWMSSFMSSSRQTAPTNTLESLFAPRTSAATPTPTRTRRASLSPSRRIHASSLPITSPIQEVQISHGTPFARPSVSGPSPFAPHVYIPPTGAPGYGGERYDWDKGFSEELQQELTLSLEPSPINGDGNIVQGSEVIGSVSKLIEKKSGSVELSGRWDSTGVVLEPKLAELIRPHLPALSRLSRKWTLLYSLDQHGISLNTLYDRCERLGQVKSAGGITHSRGALLVMKDTGSLVFGAWVGEGIQLSKGRGYYGSGESFLWRYTHPNLEVFKWSGKNDYVTLCEPDYISFGGGDGHYGLYLDDTLLDGSSARCPTFDNDPLCSPGPKKGGSVSFECVGLEVWGVNS